MLRFFPFLAVTDESWQQPMKQECKFRFSQTQRNKKIIYKLATEVSTSQNLVFSYSSKNHVPLLKTQAKYCLSVSSVSHCEQNGSMVTNSKLSLATKNDCCQGLATSSVMVRGLNENGQYEVTFQKTNQNAEVIPHSQMQLTF